jgi:hypothetical protein
MLFAERIRQLREEKRTPQCQFAVALEIYTPVDSKNERRERPAKRKQIAVIPQLLQTNENISIML